jgi:import inner membrane translocase subunit TIM17
MTHQDRRPHAERPLAPARTPFPDGICSDAGIGFIIGGTGGSVFHFLKGLRSSPSGRRLAGAAQAVRTNAPRLAGTWAGLFFAVSAVESAMYSARGKDDPWNRMTAFACVRGLYRRRKGPTAAVRSALVGAVFWGLLEVSMIGMEDLFADPYRKKSRLHAACSDEDPARAAHEAEEVSSIPG